LERITSPKGKTAQNKMFTSERDIKNGEKEEGSTKTIPIN
jgi:hypothetical protein